MTSPFTGWRKWSWNTGYLGTVLGDGHPAEPSPLLIAGFAMAMLSFTFVIRSAQHARW
jgi:hypothetical protein